VGRPHNLTPERIAVVVLPSGKCRGHIGKVVAPLDERIPNGSLGERLIGQSPDAPSVPENRRWVLYVGESVRRDSVEESRRR